MSRFFINPDSVDLNNGSIIITGEDVRHIGNVLRAVPGDVLELSNGSGTDYEVVVEQIAKDSILTKITTTKPNRTEPPIGITLFQGIPKADKMDYIIQKCIELGVTRIVPVITARTIVKFSNAKDSSSKTVRWKRIALEAAKQCDRGFIPLVEEPVRLEKALEMAEDCGLKLIPYEEENDGSLKKLLRQYGETVGSGNSGGDSSNPGAGSASPGADSSNPGGGSARPDAYRRIGILIGPEGGFEATEVEKAVKSGFYSVTLGPRILRTETAGMAVAAIIMYEIGDIGNKTEKINEIAF